MKTITTRRWQLAAMGLSAVMVAAVVAKLVQQFWHKGVLTVVVALCVLALTYVLQVRFSEVLPARATVESDAEGPRDAGQPNVKS